MKIEIEFEEVEGLKNRLRQREKHIEELESLIKSYDDKEIHKKAVQQAFRLFENYMRCIWNHFGFDWGEVHIDNVEHWLGEHWYDHEKLDINLGANINEHWKTAYLNIGVKLQKKEIE